MAVILVDSKTKKIRLHNDEARLIMKRDIKNCSLNDFINDSHKAINKAELYFCRYVEDVSMASKPTPILAVERFDGDWYITLRVIVFYDGSECIMTLISKSNDLNPHGNCLFHLNKCEI
ncbi:hypothetical protein OQE61_14015 [Cetobacterium somerae]|uniref:hypothetical protein n=1 Tax=Cetobacterium somerae TaxID=188913 RepID=UPI002255C93F|nr:hypothetical protein [Cetobacterium somerae]MCX3068615.1 hypothetical protein [Cetobacterium somerae]